MVEARLRGEALGQPDQQLQCCEAQPVYVVVHLPVLDAAILMLKTSACRLS